MRSVHSITALFVALALLAFNVFAADPKADSKAEMEAAFQAASAAMQQGPADIGITGQATLKLPASYGFIPAKEAKRVLEAMGNHTSNEIQGMIFPTGAPNANWFIVVSYIQSG